MPAFVDSGYTNSELDAEYGYEYTIAGWAGALHDIVTGATTRFPRLWPSNAPSRGVRLMCLRRSLRANRIGGANRIAGGPMAAGKNGFTKFRGVRLVDRAGHWPHEKLPEIVSQHLVDFLKST